jgi:hypothetical protein
MGAFSNIGDIFSKVDWNKAHTKTQQALAQHSPDKRGWIATAANIGGGIAGVITEAFAWEIPVVDLIAPIAVGAATRFAINKFGNMAADYFERKPARPGASPTASFAAPGTPALSYA